MEEEVQENIFNLFQTCHSDSDDDQSNPYLPIFDSDSSADSEREISDNSNSDSNSKVGREPSSSAPELRRATINLKRRINPCIIGKPPQKATSLSAIRKRLDELGKKLEDVETETSAENCAGSSASESETEIDDVDDEEPRAKKKKDGRSKWTTEAPVNNLHKRRSVDIVKERPGPVGHARFVKTELESFRLFFDDELVDLIIQRTNDKIDRERSGAKALEKRESHIDQEEFFAFIGLMLFRGLHHDTKNPTIELWGDKGAQRPLYRAIVDRCRYHFILHSLSFHNPATIRIQFTDDRFAKMRQVLDIFENNIRRYYNHTELVCLDETLRNHFSQTNCDFLIFMPDKPGQMGLFFYTLADSKDRYMSRIIPKVKAAISEDEQKTETRNLVLDITSDIHNSGRNVCADRGFSSIEIAEDLYQRDLTYVGTIMKNRVGLPTAMKNVKGRTNESTEFFWKKDSTVMAISYIPKKSKNVTMITTAHDEPIVDLGPKSKPEAVLFYNEQRCGVDIFNKMIRNLSSQPKTDDWRLCTFTFFLDVAAINAQTILRYNHRDRQEKTSRRLFLRNLINQLILPWLRRRFLRTDLKTETKRAIHQTLQELDPEFVKKNISLPKKQGVPARCYICLDNFLELYRGEELKKKKKNLNKQRWICPQCNAAVCPKHRINLPESLQLVCKFCVSKQ